MHTLASTRLASALLVSTVLLAACGLDMTGTSFCIDSCPLPPLEKSLWVVGFPQGRVDNSTVGPTGYHSGMLPVGASVTLVQVRTEVPGGVFSSDTSRQVAWSLSDTAAARIESLPGGEGRITGRAPGRVGQVLANGTPMVVWSCPVAPGYCDRLEGIEITP